MGLLTFLQFFWLLSLPMTYSLSLGCYSVFVFESETCTRNLPMTWSWRSETWQHSFPSIKVPLGFLRGLGAAVPTPSSSGCPFSQCVDFMPRSSSFLRWRIFCPVCMCFLTVKLNVSLWIYILWPRTILRGNIKIN